MEQVHLFLMYAVLGAVSGVLAGLLGVGGGIVLVPVLLFSLETQGVAATVSMHMALGTSLAIIVITALASVRAHHRRGAVEWPIVWRITPSILFGTLLGSGLADHLSGTVLKKIFGLFALSLAFYLAFGRPPAANRTLPRTAGMAMVGSGVGFVSALMGIGGGSLSVPFMVWCNVTMRQAVATSAAIGMPIAIAGATGYVITGWGNPLLPSMSLGYVHLSALLAVALSSVFSAPLGARWAHSIPPLLLRRLFATLLLMLGGRMLLV
ncbi:MAG: sulfite exporter TauE/SafE family protein [Magnetococcales bacterium]|nr:sulfite exporter TauE/SafE family protein [Magnetococcales bacterium]MBF0322130.1 sulfite exporter TauE/SafE family protein [Magnetococcales bacterium]